MKQKTPYLDEMARRSFDEKWIAIGKIMKLNPSATPEFLAKFMLRDLIKYLDRLLSVKPFAPEHL